MGRLFDNKAAAYQRVFFGEGSVPTAWKLWVLNAIGIKITTEPEKLGVDAKIVLADLHKVCHADGNDMIYRTSEATHIAIGRREVIDRINGFLNYNQGHVKRLREQIENMEMRDNEYE